MASTPRLTPKVSARENATRALRASLRGELGIVDIPREYEFHKGVALPIVVEEPIRIEGWPVAGEDEESEPSDS